MKKQVIGYTTGVYDMFHIGHLNILERAKAQCDYLIVGVSTDELVQREKNKSPVIPFDERAKIVEAIKYVDKVVPQIDKNKFAAWEKYGFDKDLAVETYEELLKLILMSPSREHFEAEMMIRYRDQVDLAIEYAKKVFGEDFPPY